MPGPSAQQIQTISAANIATPGNSTGLTSMPGPPGQQMQDTTANINAPRQPQSIQYLTNSWVLEIDEQLPDLIFAEDTDSTETNER